MALRAAAAFTVGLTGLLASTLLPAEAFLLGVLAAGAGAGAIANAARLVPATWLAVGAFYAVQVAIFNTQLHAFWQVGAVIVTLAMSGAFVAATLGLRWLDRRRNRRSPTVAPGGPAGTASAPGATRA